MIIGITGGIGSGKSTVCHILETMGYKVYVSDSKAAYLMNNNQRVIDEITQLFSTKAYSNGKLDRTFLSSQVFNDNKKLKQLEAIVHPAVFRDFKEFSSKYDNEIIFIESAIMFECGLDKLTDRIITISAPKDLRIRRVSKRDKSDIENITKRIELQLSDNERESRSDYIIKCDENNSIIISILYILSTITKQIYQ